MRLHRPILLLFLASCVAPDDGKPDVWKRTNCSVHEKLAQTALERGRAADACANAREALRVDPDRYESAVILARALLRTGSPREAEDAARRALELMPDRAETWLVCAETLLAQDRDVEARDLYRKAVQLGSKEATLILGSLELTDGDALRGIGLLEGLAGAEGATAESLEILATHHWMAGRADRALDLLERAILLDPSDRSLRQKLGQVWFSMGAESNVLELYGQERATGRSATVDQRCLAAAGLLRSGQAERAAAEYRSLASLLPDDPELRLALAEALFEQGDVEGAESAFQYVSRLDSGSRAAWVGMARCRLRAGRAANALQALETAVKIDPAHVPTRSLLAAACASSGDLERARLEAAEVRMLAPGSDLDHACRRMLQRLEALPAEEDSEIK